MDLFSPAKPLYQLLCLQAITKTKPRSKWADISKKIEENAKTPKAATKPVKSALSAAGTRYEYCAVGCHHLQAVVFARLLL